MNSFERQDIVGRRIVEVVVSIPDKPVSMSDMSESKGYLRLDSGVVIEIVGDVLSHIEPATLSGLARDRVTEKEFKDALGGKIVDVVHDGLILHVLLESGISISPGLGQFWVRP